MAEIERLHGIGPVLEALKAGRRRVLRVRIAEGRQADERLLAIEAAARSAKIGLDRVPREEIERLTQGGTHQGVLADAEALPRLTIEQVLGGGDGAAPLLVVLDSVQDPQNLGAVLRSADAASARAVVIGRDRAARLSPAAVKAAEGAAEWVPVIEVVNLARALRELKQRGLWCVGLEASAPAAIGSVDLTLPTALVLGSEGSGLRRLVRETCDVLASLPLRGHAGSLNVAAAAAVVLYEAVRQRQGSQGPRTPA